MAGARSKRPTIGTETKEYLDSSEVLRGLGRRIAQERPLGLLVAEGRRRGYVPAKKPEDALGFRHTFKATEDIQPPKGSTTAPVRELSFELSAQSFTNTKRGSADRAGILAITLEAGTNSLKREMFIEVPGGNFAQARELVVKDDAVVLAHSWSSAFRRCMSDHGCPAVYSCSWNYGFVGWLMCVFSSSWACGVWWLPCQVCAGCNCSWWCSWAVGCCRQ